LRHFNYFLNNSRNNYYLLHYLLDFNTFRYLNYLLNDLFNSLYFWFYSIIVVRNRNCLFFLNNNWYLFLQELRITTSNFNWHFLSNNTGFWNLNWNMNFFGNLSDHRHISYLFLDFYNLYKHRSISIFLDLNWNLLILNDYFSSWNFHILRYHLFNHHLLLYFNNFRRQFNSVLYWH